MSGHVKVIDLPIEKCDQWLHWWYGDDDGPCQCGKHPNTAALHHWNQVGYKQALKDAKATKA